MIDFTLNKVIPIILYVSLALVAVSFVIDIAQIEILEPKQEIPEDPYIVAENQINNGELTKALETYSTIIEKDNSEEHAWHEKGKLLIRLGDCNEAQAHYSEYLTRFPNSLRGQEGYGLAKLC